MFAAFALHHAIGATDNALPASRISAIVDVSLLTDDDIQQLIEQLMAKLDANSEWQGVGRVARGRQRAGGKLKQQGAKCLL